MLGAEGGLMQVRAARCAGCRLLLSHQIRSRTQVSELLDAIDEDVQSSRKYAGTTAFCNAHPRHRPLTHPNVSPVQHHGCRQL